jgi:hypothetical protein
MHIIVELEQKVFYGIFDIYKERNKLLKIFIDKLRNRNQTLIVKIFSLNALGQI